MMPLPTKQSLLTRLLLAIAALLLLSNTAAAKAIPLSKIQKELSLPNKTDNTNTVTISDGTNTVVFNPGFRKISINGTTCWLNGKNKTSFKEGFTIENDDITKFLKPILAASPTQVTNTPFRVFIDPGHGGEDSGAISKQNGHLEKDLVLDISKRIGARLEKEGISVSYSRTKDVFISLEERPRLAKKAKANIFVSIHGNTTQNKTARGLETFALTLAGYESTTSDSKIGTSLRAGNAFDKDNALLGFLVHSRLPGRKGQNDRGLKRARFQVLRTAPCPAILVECGFLSHDRETTSMASPRYREKVAKAIADGIIDYKNKATQK